MFIYLSLLIALIGVVTYAIAVNAKAAEIGRIMFWTGLLAFLLGSGDKVIRSEAWPRPGESSRVRDREVVCPRCGELILKSIVTSRGYICCRNKRYLGKRMH